jgi:RNA polymerase sigma-70 factor (ECF subfamily)
MPERDRMVIAARFFLELSERETAEVLGCRPGTVKSRVSRALARLRLALDADAQRRPLATRGGGDG